MQLYQGSCYCLYTNEHFEPESHLEYCVVHVNKTFSNFQMPILNELLEYHAKHSNQSEIDNQNQ